MRWSAISLCTSLLITLMLCGCSMFGKKAEPLAQDGSADMYAMLPDAEQTPTSDPAGTYDPYAAYSPPPASEPSYTTDSSGPRYHSVAKKETLYSLARLYYNDQRRWKEIYDANRAEIDDPDKIYVGQRLLIP